MISKLKSKFSKDVNLAELLKGSSSAFILKILGMILGYILSLMIAHKYGAEGSGIFALTMTYVAIGTILAKFGLDITVMKLISRLDSITELRKIKGLYLKSLKIVLVLSILVTIVFISLAQISAIYVFNKEVLANAFYFGSFMILPIALLQFHAELLRGLKKITYYFIINTISVSLISIILLSFKVEAFISDYIYIDVYIIAQLITMFLSIVLWLKNSNFLHILQDKKMISIEILKSSFPVMLTGSIALVMGWMDIIMLGIFSTEENVGIYSVALKFSMLTSITLVAVNSILSPKISKMYQNNDIQSLEKLIHQSVKLIFYSSLPILIIYFLFPSYIMGLYGEAFKVGATTLIILSIGQFFNSLSGPVGQILNMTNKEKILRNTALIAALVNLGLNYILIPLYGISGAAFATAFSGIVWNLLCIIYIYKKMNILVIYLPIRRD